MQQIAKLALLIIVSIFGFNSAYAASEKGPRCSDGIDNDGDGLIDGDDPDCRGGDVVTYTALVLKDANGEVIGPVEADVHDWGSGKGTYVFIPGAGRLARLWAKPDGFLRTADNVYFDMPGCTGNMYAAETERAFFEDVKYFADPSTLEYRYFVRDWRTDQSLPVTRMLSVASSHDCYEIDQMIQGRPIVELTIDYTPPFSLELQ